MTFVLLTGMPFLYNIQDGSKGLVQTARVSVSDQEEQELDKKWGSETQS